MNGPGYGPGHGPGFGYGIWSAFSQAIGGLIVGTAAVVIFTLLLALGIVIVRFLLVATKAAEIYVADHRPAESPSTSLAAPVVPARAPRAPRSPRNPPPAV